MEFKELEKFAKKARKGFNAGRLTNKAMGITPTEIQFLRRRMEKEGYTGTIGFYISKLCFDLIKPLIYEKNKELLLEALVEANSKKKKDYSEFIKLDAQNMIISCGDVTIETIEKRLADIDDSIFFCATIYAISQFSEKDGFVSKFLTI